MSAIAQTQERVISRVEETRFTRQSSRRLSTSSIARGPAMLQCHVPERAGELAQRLCLVAGGKVTKVVKLAHSPTLFWSEALGLARRVVNV